MLNIAIIGTGPTAIYTAKYLVAKGEPMAVTMFETQAEAGKGTPYSQDWNSEAMLSNIASIEIPPVTESLVEWLDSKDDYQLAVIGMVREEIDERAFYPRVVLGEYFHEQLDKLKFQAAERNIRFVINANNHVEDVDLVDDGVQLKVRDNVDGKFSKQIFSHAIMATGHVWSKDSEIRPGYFSSPWPVSELGKIGQCSVGILGTSLSAIDAMVALAVARGTFRRDGDGGLEYLPEPGTDGFKVTLMSRKGLLPEADFYHPVPYTKLNICTQERVDSLINREAKEGLLDDAFMLFKAELAQADKEYAAKINLADLSLEEFCKAYFREREECDTFVWAERNLVEAKRNQELEFTVPWRYSILKMHEIIGKITQHLTAEEYQRFNQFKQIFVDDYATVPHESIERILAMRKVGKLEILSVGADYKLDKETPDTGAVLTYDDKTIHFPAFIEATGQRALSARDFPFPSLWEHGITKNAVIAYEPKKGFKSIKKPLAVGGIALDMAYHPVSNSAEAFRLYCPSIPFMLGQFPFAQGITSSHDIGKVIAEDLSEVDVEQPVVDIATNNAQPIANAI